MTRRSGALEAACHGESRVRNRLLDPGPVRSEFGLILQPGPVPVDVEI
ncbi:hypothetical protein [Microbacterium yannicii]|nr:hypothetical protein [Microbacterium yannicii]